MRRNFSTMHGRLQSVEQAGREGPGDARGIEFPAQGELAAVRRDLGYSVDQLHSRPHV